MSMKEDNDDGVLQLNEDIVDDIDFEPIHEAIPVILEVVKVSKSVPEIELDEIEELSDDKPFNI